MDIIKQTVLCLALAGMAGSLVCLLAPKSSEGLLRAVTLAFVILAAATPYSKRNYSSPAAWHASFEGDFGSGDFLEAIATAQWKAEAERLLGEEIKTILRPLGAENSTITVMAEAGDDGIVYAADIYIILDETCKAKSQAVSEAVEAACGIVPTVKRGNESQKNGEEQ